MTARQLRLALRRLQLSQRGLARRLRVDVRTARRWVLAEGRIPESVALLLDAWERYPRLIPPLPRPRRTR